ncbi:MAG: hypothetical protein AB1403_17760, partial [Candidatus Riflebacteria bacterium]
MALHSLIIGKDAKSQRNLWIFALLLGIIIGCSTAGLGIVVGKIAKTVKTSYLIASVVLGLISGIMIGWFGREVLRGIVTVISRDLTTMVGLKPGNFVSTRKGMGREMDIFDQMFKLVMSVLKRVLVISLKLEEASIDLDRTAQISSQVIKEIVDGVGETNEKALNNASNLRETISSLESSFSLSKDISSKLIIAKEDSQSVSERARSTQMSVKEAVQKMLKIKELTDGSTSLVNDLNDRSKQIGTILTEIANI